MTTKISRSYSLGIDPGWVNLGIALLEVDYEWVPAKEGTPGFWAQSRVRPKRSAVLNPSQKTLSSFLEFDVSKFVGDCNVGCITIERYVPYNNVFTAEAESINQVIGGLRAYFTTKRIGENLITYPYLVRAIDWKTQLVKHLVKTKDFDNPSNDLDKKFTMAAARASFDEIPEGFEMKTDHEGDAYCLAYVGVRKQEGLITLPDF